MLDFLSFFGIRLIIALVIEGPRFPFWKGIELYNCSRLFLIKFIEICRIP